MKRWIHDIGLSHKLTAIVVASLIPISLLTFFYVRAEHSKIAASRLELAGLAAYRPLEGMLAPLADMQLWAAARAAGDPVAKDKLLQARSLVESQVAGCVSNAVDYGAAAGEDARRCARRSSNKGPLAATRTPVPVNEAVPDTTGGSGE